MGLKIFYFVAQMGDRWRKIVDDQIGCMRASGLIDAAECVYICQAGNQKVRYGPKCKVAYRSQLDQYEYPALHMVKQYTKPDDTVLYLHTKGASRPPEHQASADKWREYMMWGCVERWSEHVKALEKCDVSGVLHIALSSQYRRKCNAEKCFAGNFWWARGDYIQKVPMPEFIPNRFGAEGWIMGANPRVNDLHNVANGKPITTTFPFGPDFTRANYDTHAVRMVESRHEIINALIKKFNYRSYCEIGVYHFHCFNHVQCAEKVCVDPGVKNATFHITSDAFFAQNKRPFDIYFIDGLHTEAQAYRDACNALQWLSPGGTIVMHDCNPETAHEQRDTVDYDGKGVWVGTTWRAFARLRMERPDLNMVMVDSDFGCGIIRKGEQKTYTKTELTYPYFVQNRRRLMNVLDPEDFYAWLAKLA
jgi:hypothetical protein